MKVMPLPSGIKVARASIGIPDIPPVYIDADMAPVGAAALPRLGIGAPAHISAANAGAPQHRRQIGSSSDNYRRIASKKQNLQHLRHTRR